MGSSMRIKQWGKKRKGKTLFIHHDLDAPPATTYQQDRLNQWYEYEEELRKQKTKARIEEEVMKEWYKVYLEGKKEGNEMYGNYVVINQWNDGRMLACIVAAHSSDAAARAKQAHLNATSKQSNNRVVAVSKDPIEVQAYGLSPQNEGWSSVPLVNVALTPVPVPVPPKQVKVMGTSFGKPLSSAAKRYAEKYEQDYDDAGSDWGLYP